jgi:hypothetical protein
MTSLEQALASILASIEDTRASGSSRALAALLRRKEAICAALAAPEQSWHDPHAQASAPIAQRKAA